MTRMTAIARRFSLLAVFCMALLLGACGGDGSAPESGDAPGAALSGGMNETRGIIRGTIGLGGVEVKLLLSQDDVCQVESEPLQTTMSKADGSYAFEEAVNDGASYCVGYEGQTLACDCDWSAGDCDCSANASP